MHQRLVPKPFKICMQNKDCLSRLTIGLRERLTNPRQWSPSLSSDHVTRQRGPNPVSRHLQLVLHHQPSLQFLQKTFKIHPIFSSKFPKMSSTPKPVIPAPLPVSNIDRNDRKECYRTHNSLGASLRKTLEEMTASGKLTAYAAEKILIHYDMQVAGALAAVTPRLSMKAESVQSYQVEGGGVHKFLFKNATVSVAGLQKRDELSVSNVPTLRLIAYPGTGVVRKKGCVTTSVPPASVATTVEAETEDVGETGSIMTEDDRSDPFNDTINTCDTLNTTLDSEAGSTFLQEGEEDLFADL